GAEPLALVDEVVAVLVDAQAPAGERDRAAPGPADCQRAQRPPADPDRVRGNRGDAVRGQRHGETVAVVLVAAGAEADNRHRPAVLRLGAGGQHQVEVDRANTLDDRRSRPGADLREVLVWMDEIGRREVLAEGNLADGTGDVPEQAEIDRDGSERRRL